MENKIMTKKKAKDFKTLGSVLKQIDSLKVKCSYYENLFSSADFSKWTFTQANNSMVEYGIAKEKLKDYQRRASQLTAEQFVKSQDAEYIRKRVKYIDSLRR